LRSPLALAFGGMTVVYDGKNFQVHAKDGNSVVLQRADLPEIAQFLCRHGEDLRNGALIHDDGHARRIENHRHSFLQTAGVRWGSRG
jgi:hypothetical protein